MVKSLSNAMFGVGIFNEGLKYSISDLKKNKPKKPKHM